MGAVGLTPVNQTTNGLPVGEIFRITKTGDAGPVTRDHNHAHIMITF